MICKAQREFDAVFHFVKLKAAKLDRPQMSTNEDYDESSVLEWRRKISWDIFFGNSGPRRRTGFKRSGYDTKLFRKHDSAYNFGSKGQMQMERLAVVSS